MRLMMQPAKGVKLYETDGWAVQDTGCTSTCVGMETLKRLNVRYEMTKLKNPVCYGTAGDRVQAVARATVELPIKDIHGDPHLWMIDAHVLEGKAPMLIGNETWDRLVCDQKQRYGQLQKDGLIIPLYRLQSSRLWKIRICRCESPDAYFMDMDQEECLQTCTCAAVQRRRSSGRSISCCEVAERPTDESLAKSSNRSQRAHG